MKKFNENNIDKLLNNLDIIEKAIDYNKIIIDNFKNIQESHKYDENINESCLNSKLNNIISKAIDRIVECNDAIRKEYVSLMLEYKLICKKNEQD